jgi:putative tricarboxylic transport membrane protein
LELLHNLTTGFEVALSLHNLFFAFLGCLLGTLIGVLPGIGPTAGVTILVPLTFGLPPTTAFIMMSGLFYGTMYGGSTTAILMKVPGEAASVVTCIDGYEMARQGRAGPALGMAAFASFIAGTVGIMLLAIVAAPLVDVALAFGPAEYFALACFGLTLVTALTGQSLVKGLMSTLFGVIIACVGVDAVSGEMRFTFGSIYLLDGLGFVNIAVGLFALSEVLINIEEPTKEIYAKMNFSLRSLMPSIDDWRRSKGALARGTILGFLIGVLPGTGPTIASFLSYVTEKKLSRTPERFGKGAIEGVAGPEGANNAAAQGSFVPMLTLGIPGSGVTAILLGALMVHGLRPGPMLMQDNPEFVWGLIASMYIGNVMLLILNLPLIGIWVQLLRIPFIIITPAIVTIALTGIYATETTIFDLWVTLVFGLIGYLMRKLDFPLAPIVLAVVLTPMIETSLKQALILSNGSFGIFFTRPISAVLLLLGVLFLLAPLLSGAWRSMREQATAD